MPDSARLLTSDPLSDVLGALRLRGTMFARTEAGRPSWAIAFPEGDAHFHVVERGSAVVTVASQRETYAASAGDLVILPHGTGHVLSDRPRRRGVPLNNLVRTAWQSDCQVLKAGEGAGGGTRLICGTFHLDAQGRRAFLSVLPAVLHVRGQDGRSLEPIDLVLRLFSLEVHGATPGSALSAARLIELLLVQAIRAWLATQPSRGGGWLGAMRDRHVGLALARLHANPGRAWTVDELAREVGLSRSPLARRFTALVGEPPLRYLTRWRMLTALQLLRSGATVSDAAREVGYDSDAAFSRAFKKQLGQSPIRFR